MTLPPIPSFAEARPVRLYQLNSPLLQLKSLQPLLKNSTTTFSLVFLPCFQFKLSKFKEALVNLITDTISINPN